MRGERITRMYLGYVGSVDPSRKLVPVDVGYERCAPSHSFGPAVRTEWLLHFVLSGKGRFKTKRGEYTLKRGDMFVIKPMEVTYYEADSSDPWEYVWLGFEVSFELPALLTGGDYISAPYLEEPFRELVFSREFPDGCVGFTEHATASAWEIIGRLYRHSEGRHDENSYVRAATDIMRAELHRPLRVGDIADRLHLNRSYFTTLFTRAMGVSPGEYLYELRMSRSKELLLSGEYSVAVVAASVGYSDPFVFSRAFKRRYGVPPNAYTQA